MELLIEMRRYLTRPRVRPWALVVPIFTVLICLPLLRPLRHPDPRHMSDDEAVRLATIQAIVEHRTLAIDPADADAVSSHVIHVGEHVYSDQPPVLSMLLAGPYWLMTKAGLTFEKNPNLTAYLLTVLGATLPVALGGGLVYRMGRIFELRRPVRTALSAAVVLGTGMLSYGVVLNSHGIAAALVLCATGCLIHVAGSSKPAISGGWLAVGGFAAALAAVIEPVGVIFLGFIMIAPLVMRWRANLRVGGLLLLLIGATPPLVLHAALNTPVTGDILPGRFHPELLEPGLLAANDSQSLLIDDSDAFNADRGLSPFDAEDARAAAEEQAKWSSVMLRNVSRVCAAIAGSHGVLSHFPVLIFGVIGVFGVMHRHWPSATKVLAAAALTATMIVMIVSTVSLPHAWSAANAFIGAASPFGNTGMFGPEPFLVFLPVLLFWSGAWLRKPHRLGTRIVAGIFLTFSILVTLVGASDPFPRNGYDSYTVAEAFNHLFSGRSATHSADAFAQAR